MKHEELQLQFAEQVRWSDTSSTRQGAFAAGPLAPQGMQAEQALSCASPPPLCLLSVCALQVSQLQQACSDLASMDAAIDELKHEVRLRLLG